MPKLKMLLNLGTDDARRLGLDPEEARAEKTVNVDQDVADVLLRNVWAATEDDKPNCRRSQRFDMDRPGSMPGQPTEAGQAALEDEQDDDDTQTQAGAQTQAQTRSPDFDAMTKDEIQRYAADRKIGGISQSMSKDDMVRTIERASAQQQQQQQQQQAANRSR